MGSNKNGGESNRKASKPHVVAVPYIGQGHLIPFLELAKLFASQGLTVSYIATPANVARLQPQVDKVVMSSNSNMDIRLISLAMPQIEGVPPGIESSDNVPFHIVNILLSSSYKLAGPFEEWLHQQMKDAGKHIADSPPICIISDMFMGWAQRIGAKFGVPTVFFHTCGAFAISLTYSFVTCTPQKEVEGEKEYFQVPKLNFDLQMRKLDLPRPMWEPDSHPHHELMKGAMNTSMEGCGVIFNTFYELEPLGIDNIKSLTGRPVWSIGPLLPTNVSQATWIDRGTSISRGKAADISEAECLQWLDCRKPNSVVFVCFGSQLSPNDEQNGALARGLESSGQAFIWAMRRVLSMEEAGFPEGFEERTKDRGLVIWGWAPQLLILSHPSVGAFLSHCGWNSTLESVSLGVPMITWPMFGEQPFNSKLLVEQLGIAEEICLGMDKVADEEVVKRAVLKLLAEEEGIEMRMRAQELRKEGKTAVERGGSSHSNLQSVVEYMRELHETWMESRKNMCVV